MDLPSHWKIHNVFYTEKLEPYRQSTIPGRSQPPPEPEFIGDEETYKVRTIGNSRYNRRRKRVEYLVIWEGYADENATWEPYENLLEPGDMDDEALQVIREFHLRYPRKLRDHRVRIEEVPMADAA